MYRKVAALLLCTYLGDEAGAIRWQYQRTCGSVCTRAVSLLLAHRLLLPFPVSPPKSLRRCLAWSPPGPHRQGQGVFLDLPVCQGVPVIIRVQNSLIIKDPIVYTVERDHLKAQGTLQKAEKWVSMPTSLRARGSHSKMGFPNSATTWTAPTRPPNFDFVYEKGVIPPTPPAL